MIIDSIKLIMVLRRFNKAKHQRGEYFLMMYLVLRRKRNLNL